MSSVFVSGLLIVVYNKKIFCHGSLTNMYIDKGCEPVSENDDPFMDPMVAQFPLPLEGGNHGIKFYLTVFSMCVMYYSILMVIRKPTG